MNTGAATLLRKGRLFAQKAPTWQQRFAMTLFCRCDQVLRVHKRVATGSRHNDLVRLRFDKP